MDSDITVIVYRWIHYDALNIYSWLVVEVSTLLKIWKSSGMTIPNIWKTNQCSKPPTRSMDINGAGILNT